MNAKLERQLFSFLIFSMAHFSQAYCTFGVFLCPLSLSSAQYNMIALPAHDTQIL